MGDGEISVRSDVFFTFYFLLSTLYFLFSEECLFLSLNYYFWVV
ncbi:MAG: hypothetical protein AB1422_01035 [bacterium]